jgi:hypothetical protein
VANQAVTSFLAKEPPPWLIWDGRTPRPLGVAELPPRAWGLFRPPSTIDMEVAGLWGWFWPPQMVLEGGRNHLQRPCEWSKPSSKALEVARPPLYRPFGEVRSLPKLKLFFLAFWGCGSTPPGRGQKWGGRPSILFCTLFFFCF